jgi:hypothetical protein
MTDFFPRQVLRKMHEVPVFEDGILAEHTVDVAAQSPSRLIVAPSKVVEIENDRDVVSDGEVFDCASDGGNFGRCVGAWNATLRHLDWVASVQYCDVTEVEGDRVNLEEDVVRPKVLGQLFG